LVTAAGLTQTGVKIGEQRGHLLVRKPAGKRRHHSLPSQHNARNLGVAGRRTAGQSGSGKDPMQVGRNLFEIEVVVLVAMSAANIVEVLPFRFLLREGWFAMAARKSDYCSKANSGAGSMEEAGRSAGRKVLSRD